MTYEPKAVSSKKTSKEKILDLFNDLHYKWRDGMDITDYRKEKRGEGVIVIMDTFMDDTLVNLGATLIDNGKTTHFAVVAWLSCCEYQEGFDDVIIHTRSAWFAEKASNMFGQLLYDVIKKPVNFVFNPSVKDRIAA